MLNLKIVKRLAGGFLLLIVLILAGRQMALAQGVAIRSPREDEVLRGKITITGNSDISGFKIMSLHFAFQESSPETWFLIYESQTPVREGPLTTWDTTLISDGVYQLRLQVVLEDGAVLEDIISNLVIANEQPAPTRTMENGLPTFTAAVTTIAPTQQTPTPLPENPLKLDGMQITQSLKTGALMALVILISLLVYRLIRSRLES